MKVLHIVATPRAAASNTLKVSEEFFSRLREEAPDVTVETLDLFADDLPRVAGGNIEAKYTLMMGAPIDPGHAESWAEIEALIERFLAADAYVVSVPMWNLSIPYALKYFIDAVVQPGYLFRYNEMGVPEGLAVGRSMVVITSRGGDYSPGTPFHAYDFMEPYLRAIFGFVGIYDIQFVNAQPVDIRPLRDAALERAFTEAAEAARRLVHGAPEAPEAAEAPPIQPVLLPEYDGPGALGLAAGDLVFSEGSESDFVYMIDEGTFEVFRVEEGAETVLNTLGAGQYFGELGALLGAPRAASVRAVSDARVTVYSPADFRRVVLRN